MAANIFLSRENSKIIVKCSIHFNDTRNFYDLLEFCKSDQNHSKKLSIYKDEDYYFSIDKHKNVNIDLSDRILEYYSYFRNGCLRLFIHDVNEQETADNNGKDTTLISDAFNETEVFKTAEQMVLALNADGSKNKQASTSRLTTGKRASLDLIKTQFRTLKTQQVKETLKSVAEASKIDLCFMVDCTSSMQVHINNVKNNIRNLLDDLSKRYLNHSARISFVGYRDYYDDTTGLTMNFVDSSKHLKVFYNHIQKIAAFGGGDSCENVYSGFVLANSLSWTNSTKILIHIADCPSHGIKYSNGLDDHFPNEDPDFTGQFKQLSDKGVQYHFHKLTRYTDQMIAEFKKQAPKQMVVKEHTIFSSSMFAEVLNFTASISISQTLDSKLATKKAMGGCSFVDFLGGVSLS